MVWSTEDEEVGDGGDFSGMVKMRIPRGEDSMLELGP